MIHSSAMDTHVHTPTRKVGPLVYRFVVLIVVNLTFLGNTAQECN